MMIYEKMISLAFIREVVKFSISILLGVIVCYRRDAWVAKLIRLENVSQLPQCAHRSEYVPMGPLALHCNS